MSTQFIVLAMLSLLCLTGFLAGCKDRIRHGRERYFSRYELFTGTVTIISMAYLGNFPIVEAGENVSELSRQSVLKNMAPTVNSVFGIQNISLEDPLLSKLRESAVAVTEAYQNHGPPPDTNHEVINVNSEGKPVPAYWRIKQ